MTIARAFSNTFAGIRAHDVPLFVGAQLIGALCAMWICRWLLHERRGGPVHQKAEEMITPRIRSGFQLSFSEPSSWHLDEVFVSINGR